MQDYFHEKAEESRHNETLSYLAFIAGSIFFIGGILETLSTNTSPEWFFFLPYQISNEPYSILSLFLTSGGVALIISGIIMGLYYAHDRTWYIQELFKTNAREIKGKLGTKKPRRRDIKAPKT